MLKKNILIVSGVFIPEPVVSAKILFDLSCELSKKYNVTILRPKPSRPLGFNFSKFNNFNFSFKVIQLNSYVNPNSNLFTRFFESYSMGLHCVRFIKNNRSKIDLIYNAPWQLVGRYMIYKIANKFKIPFITPVQDVYPESILSKLPNWKFIQKPIISLLLPFDKLTLLNSSLVHTISEKMKNYLISTRNLNKEKIIVVNNWQDENHFLKFKKNKKIIKLRSNKLFTFMYLGNIGPLAGLEVLIYAFNKANIKNSRLVIAGSGSAKENLIKLANKFPNTLIEFWNVPDGDVPKIQDMSDIMILPIKKGFSSTSIPSKLPAYMFSSKPIIASVDKNSDTAKSIIDSRCGWICDPENINELSKKLIKANNCNKNKLEKMGSLGFEYSLNFFSRKKNLSKLSRAIENIIN